MVRSSGGIQGYCGGLPAAVVLACTANENELADSIITGIRLAYATGLYAELGDDSRNSGRYHRRMRLETRRPGRGDSEIVSAGRYP